MTESKSEKSDEGRGKPYDLEERTAVFGENVIALVRKIPVNAVTRRLLDQLVGAATSVGANYLEADDAVSKQEAKELHLIFAKIYRG